MKRKKKRTIDMNGQNVCKKKNDVTKRYKKNSIIIIILFVRKKIHSNSNMINPNL